MTKREFDFWTYYQQERARLDPTSRRRISAAEIVRAARVAASRVAADDDARPEGATS